MAALSPIPCGNTLSLWRRKLCPRTDESLTQVLTIIPLKARALGLKTTEDQYLDLDLAMQENVGNKLWPGARPSESSVCSL